MGDGTAPSAPIALAALPAPQDSPSGGAGPVLTVQQTGGILRMVDTGIDQAPLLVQVQLADESYLAFTDPHYARIYYRQSLEPAAGHQPAPGRRRPGYSG